MLPEARRQRLQAEIRKFMDAKKSVFEANLKPPLDAWIEYVKATERLYKLRRALKKSESIEIDGVRRIPSTNDIDIATKLELKNQKKYQQIFKGIDEARISLHKALDEMRQTLGSV